MCCESVNIFNQTHVNELYTLNIYQYILILKCFYCRYKKNLKHFYIIHPTFWTKVNTKPMNYLKMYQFFLLISIDISILMENFYTFRNTIIIQHNKFE